MNREDVILADLPANADAAHPWGRALGREHLDTLLLTRARQLGVTVLQPWTVRSTTGCAGRYRCDAVASDTREQWVLEAPVMIGAYGSWETAPTRRDARRPRALSGDLFAFKANFTGVALAPGVLPILALPGGYGGMVVADHGVATLACCIRRDVLGTCRLETRGKSASVAVERWLKTHCRGVREALHGGIRTQPWLTVGPIRPGIRLLSEDDGLFLVGNAAGEAHPIIGEGISMAMQSAWMLCDLLIAHRAASDPRATWRHIHREYARAWHRSFAARIRWSAVFAQLAMRPQLARGLLPLLMRWPALVTGAARLSGKVRCAIDVKPPITAVRR
jgi:flavin-dependent dehydrogenase